MNWNEFANRFKISNKRGEGNKAGKGLSEGGMRLKSVEGKQRRRGIRSGGLAVVFLLAAGLVLGETRPEGGSGIWITEVREGMDPLAVAEEMGARYVGPLTGVEHTHRFSFAEKMSRRSADEEPVEEVIRRQMAALDTVVHFEKEVLMRRYPRNFVPPDPRFPDQWHLDNSGQTGGKRHADIAVRPVWDAGWRGRGVTIAIVDTGTDIDHPDLAANYIAGSGRNYNDRENGDDNDPSPDGFEDNHGTAVAGISLAASNELYGLGIAPEAGLVPLRLIAGPYDSGAESEALSHLRQRVDIYNNSWGPSDNGGVRYQDASETLKRALADNVEGGRGGLGNIYVWAGGNGGQGSDNSNYDGYNALPYTISVGAVNDAGIRASYSEEGANLLVVAPSQGGGGSGIVTTDRMGGSGYTDGDMTDSFNGTSAAAPMVSGVVALLLEAYPELDWREVQQILALSAEPVDFREETWTRNGGGRWVSHEYGFGRVNAAAALALAGEWTRPGPLETGRWVESDSQPIPELGAPLTVTFGVEDPMVVQFVRLDVAADHDNWGDLRMELVSPEGTVSVLAESHPGGNDPGSWTYLSTRHLGELAAGEWVLRVWDEVPGASGRLESVELTLMGNAEVGNGAPEGESLEIFTAQFPVELDLLAGVLDPDGDPVDVLSVQRPSGGALTDLGSGRFLYERLEDADVRDSFSVLLSDGRGGTLRRMVRISDPRPVARNDLFPVRANGEAVWLPVLQNDQDLDGDALEITDFSAPADVTVTMTEPANGREPGLLLEAAEGASGVRRIEYSITDNSDGESSAWATVTFLEEADAVALEFDGVDDYLRVPPTGEELALEDDFTLEAVIKPDDWGEHVTGFGRIVERGDVVFFLNGNGHAFYHDRSLVAYFIVTDGAEAREMAANSPMDSLELGKEQHVALTYDSGDPGGPVRFYVDGEEVGTSYPVEVGPAGVGWRVLRNADQPLYSGESENGQRAFNGQMRGLRIWDEALEAAELEAAARGELARESALFFPLDETLEMRAVSSGSLEVEAELSGAQRVPARLPWEGLAERFRLSRDEGNGWWREQVLGRLYGDAYPWVWVEALGWVYSGQEAGRAGYYLYRPEGNWGWLYSNRLLYPWWSRLAEGSWLRYFEDGPESARFYSSSAGWLSEESELPPAGK